MPTKGTLMSAEVVDAVKTGAIAAGCVAAFPVYVAGVVVTMAVKKGGLETRLGTAVIWPILFTTWTRNSTRTLGGFQNKQLLAANRYADKLMRKEI